MSKIMIETRMCDSCERPYDESIPAWMTLTFPNVQSEDDAPEFDFCTYECLQNWVNEDDQSDEPVPSPKLTEAYERMMETTGVGGVEPPVRPTMTLAEAIAMGLQPNSSEG